MRSQRSFSFATSPHSNRRHEQSILNEYKRLSLEQQSFYFSTDPINYSSLPKFLPKNIAKQFTHCIFLENFTFYEMLTFAIFQYLIKSLTLAKTELINKLKNLVCNDNFLDFASYTKGLILKGLKLMVENQSPEKPVAEGLLGNEKLPAFCECWKQMIFYFNEKRTQKPEDVLSSSIIEIFTNFFEVDIHFHTKKGKDLQLEVVKSKKKASKSEIISIVLISNTFDEQDENSAKEQSISEISSIYGNWSYYILVNNPTMLNKKGTQSIEHSLAQNPPASKLKRIMKRQTLTIDFPELFPIDEEKNQMTKSTIDKQNANQIIANIKFAVKKGQNLLEDMKKFTENIGKA